MEYTAENIETEITLLPSLLKLISMFQLGLCYKNVDKKIVENVAISCSKYGRSTDISMKNMNTNDDDIITQFMLNTMLHHVGT